MLSGIFLFGRFKNNLTAETRFDGIQCCTFVPVSHIIHKINCMAKSHQTWNKKEKEKRKQKKHEEKAQRKEERKANSSDGSLESMLAYVDEFGNITSTPPDPTKKKTIKADQIELGVPKRPSVSNNPNRTGKVTFFNESKGFGFIEDDETKERIFSHISGHLDPVKENDQVHFLIGRGPKGPTAIDVKIAE
jgi:cold shock CspA family protein